MNRRSISVGVDYKRREPPSQVKGQERDLHKQTSRRFLASSAIALPFTTATQKQTNKNEEKGASLRKAPSKSYLGLTRELGSFNGQERIGKDVDALDYLCELYRPGYTSSRCYQ